MKSLLQQQFQWHLRLLATRIAVNHKETILQICVYTHTYCIYMHAHISLGYCLGLLLLSDIFKGNI